MYEDCSESPDLELTIKVLNINHGMNDALMKSCKKLNDYSIYVAKVREYSQTQPINRAVANAIDYCISHDILRDFLTKERKAVTMYSLYEYNQAGHMKVIQEEAFSNGEKHGIAIGKEQGIAIGMEQGISTGTQSTVDLFNWLFSNGRIADAQKAASDPAFLDELFREYNTSSKP